MIGAIAGDIIGSRFEFDNHKSKKFSLFGGDGIARRECRFTDDSIMTVAVADALLQFAAVDNDSVFQETLIDKMHLYGKLHRMEDYGERFFTWLDNALREPYGSWGNGSAMRVSPVGWYARSLDEAEHIAKLTAEVTHNHPEGIKGAQAVAAAIWLARKGSDKGQIKEYIEKKYYPVDFLLTIDEIRPHYIFDVSCQGSVPVAFMAFFESDGYVDAVRNAVSVGGDSDTIACITGGIAEAYYGLPEEIKEQTISRLSNDLLETAVSFSEKYCNEKEKFSV